MEKIVGLIDAPFTPFYANGDVNLEPIEAYAKMLQKNGLKGVFINGSSGEGYMLTTEERMQLAERWVSVAPEGFKVIVHVGSCCLRESVRLAEHAQKIGAWGIGSMAPPFPKIGRIEELVEYCETIANAAPELPFYYYHIPAFNGAFLPMVDLLKAVDGRIKNFAGIKYTYEALYEYNQCRLYGGGKFDMLHGQDETILPSLAQGVLVAASAAQPTTTVVSLWASSTHGTAATSRLLARSRTSHRRLSTSSVTSAVTSWAESAS